MILHYLLLSLFFNFIKTAINRLEKIAAGAVEVVVVNTPDGVSKMSSVCGIHQVESQAHACYITQYTYKSYKSTDLTTYIRYVNSSRTTDESLHFLSPFREPKHFHSLSICANT